MHRQPTLDLLTDYRARYPRETEAVERYTDFVRTHTDCFDRSLAVGHVTGSAWLVNGAGTHVLLTHHRKLGRWLQLGGHADGDNDPLRVAMREASEESGLRGIEPVDTALFDLDIHAIPARGDEPEHSHYDLRFALRARGAEDFTVSDESHDLAWVRIDDLASMTDERSMLRMAAKWIDLAESLIA
ncbi:MAG: NUDIX hydrolase [Planctomycetota bacterium]|jgi:8-oxo-dGTP pyrophosphatase MutT (NUDIX family)